ncbi:formamidase [Caldalkalibacillus thermarum]|uniref:acetamidase/formamidase family protein n=1 Tax=Caldalkalibacillus thermarum TaxID=296745 RepID=UPI00166B15A4|nr:acetamidase/formamidase family protein [Caldalkalibacillus thermarum]GGK36526.1 formamidase [Caldalkalibacillus thermarum]
MSHTFISYQKELAHYSLDMMADVRAVVNPGEVFKVETMNAFSQETNSEQELNKVIDMGFHHPFTGPVYINGAKSGMTLEVVIYGIEIDEYAYTCVSRSSGVLKGRFQGRNYRKVKINDSLFTLGNITHNIEPCLGGIGVSDPKGTRNGATGKHGGNLDFRWLRSGSKVYLPIAKDGGFLYMGDLHARQGNGELSGIALESSGTVELSVQLHASSIPTPILELDNEILIVGYGETFDEAVKLAAEISVDIVSKSKNIEPVDAYMFLGLSSDIVTGHLTGTVKNFV